MNLSDLVPKFRIEIRRAGSKKSDPWEIAELAHTDAHVTAKSPHWKNNPDLETRVVPNLPAAPQPVRLDPLPRVPVLPSPAPQPTPVASPMISSAPAPSPIVATAPAVVAPLPAEEPLAAIAAPSPEIPYAVGDRMTDIHSPPHPALTITAINPDGRSGFAWECPEHPNPAARKGFVPLASIGCYEKYQEEKPARRHAPAKAKKSAAKKPTAKAHKRKR